MVDELRAGRYLSLVEQMALRRKARRTPGKKTPFNEPAVTEFAIGYLRQRIPAGISDLYSEPYIAFGKKVQAFINEQFGLDVALGDDALIGHAKRLITAYLNHRSKEAGK